MAFVSRAELEALERRLIKAEQTIFRQEGQIKLLQARLDGGPSPVDHLGVASYRDRSRSPRPLAAMAPPKPANGAGNMSVTEFAMTYSLDDKCIEALSKQPLEVQQHVILQGPVEGRNPSAMVMGRLAKATSEFMAYGGSPGAGASNYPTSGYSHNHGYSHESDIQANVEEFLMANGVDDKAADSLRSQSLECQAAVLGQGPAEGRNPSAMVMGRIAKFNRGEI